MNEKQAAIYLRELPGFALIIALAFIVGCQGLSCSGNDGELAVPSDSDVSRSYTPIGLMHHFSAFKEIRFEITPETPTVGEIVTIKAIAIPVDDYSTIRHPWIDKMRADSPSFTIEGYPYYCRMSLYSGGPSNSTDSAFIAISSCQKQAVYLVHKSGSGSGFMAEIYNMVFGRSVDTIILKVKFTSPGTYALMPSFGLRMSGYAPEHLTNFESTARILIEVRERK